MKTAVVRSNHHSLITHRVLVPGANSVPSFTHFIIILKSLACLFSNPIFQYNYRYVNS